MNDEHGRPGEAGEDAHGATGGRGGAGGAGGRGHRTGGAGGRGGRGGHVEDQGKHRATIIAVLMTLLLVVLGYSLMLDHRAQALVQCEERNEQMNEINDRVPTINLLLRHERERHERRHKHPERPKYPHEIEVAKAEPVKLSDCEATLLKPWPLDGF
jgi:hypothetical protein